MKDDSRLPCSQEEIQFSFDPYTNMCVQTFGKFRAGFEMFRSLNNRRLSWKKQLMKYVAWVAQFYKEFKMTKIFYDQMESKLQQLQASFEETWDDLCRAQIRFNNEITC